MTSGALSEESGTHLTAGSIEGITQSHKNRRVCESLCLSAAVLITKLFTSSAHSSMTTTAHEKSHEKKIV